jgi:hypothetical protein
LYLINYLSLQAAQQLFIAVGRYRTGIALIGPKDGVNQTFHTPGYEKLTHNLPYLSVQVYFNGVRQTLLRDYYLAESGGPGTGYDTIVLDRVIRGNDEVSADYIATGS